jgi:hypothetical protein
LATIESTELEKVEILMRLNNLDLKALRAIEKEIEFFKKENEEKEVKHGKTKENRN